MEIYGGRAGFNSVSFTGERYYAVSEIKNNEITTYIKPKKEGGKITDILSRIPFARSYSLFIELIINRWKQLLSTFIILFLFEKVLNMESNSIFLTVFSNNSLLGLSSFLVLVSLVIKITPIGKLHGAEHMCAHAYTKNLNLTLETEKDQPRTHKDCGTNFITSIFICFLMLQMVFGDSVWVILLSWSIGYELWKCKPKIAWDIVVVIGKAAQYLLFTSKPKEKHILVAIEAIKKLEEKESEITIKRTPKI
ncbi:DUF1385 domain-containing protein [Sediminibacillus terrae]|uniref:DUF1385 domain-containing protein n=1 Tax=Sediminibacillus terrae TaxID=1562106 RepID=UPI001296FF0F|nr:DUF1385 domain-containing protein [Sediminibacillus terrae]